MSAHLKATFKELSTALQSLHRDLLMLEAKKLEAELGRKITPYELLHASLNDPGMAWLRLMSELIVNIDTILDEMPNLSGQEAGRVASQVLNIIERPAEPVDTDFWRNYSKYLSSNPEVIMKHSRVKEILERLRPNL
ncbi:MAG: hypothetical protein AB7G93_23005 [Bdellovibrionales bacterium]